MISILLFLRTALFVLTALFLHEMAHVLAVNYLGGKVEKVGLFPLGFAARFRGLERLRGWERYVIYAAGSVANLIIAGWTFAVSHLSYFRLPWLEEFAFYSLILCIFNLLPILPLDGGRIFHQFLSNRIGIIRANRFMLKFGAAAVYLFFVLGFVQTIFFPFNISLLLAALYLRQQNKQMKTTLQMDFFCFVDAKKLPSKLRLMPIRHVTLPPNTQLKFAMERITIDHFTFFRINEGEKFSEKDLMAQVFKEGINTRIVNKV